MWGSAMCCRGHCIIQPSIQGMLVGRYVARQRRNGSIQNLFRHNVSFLQKLCHKISQPSASNVLRLAANGLFFAGVDSAEQGSGRYGDARVGGNLGAGGV